ncbi:MAG TPA: helix-turn-helix transcriptional regulator [Dysgonamonadaceae bacterium]|nr:helix-turn-helix transcriptional regulator [Dysgonamonadaceae bacterium]HUI31981.1 helix-turn-helix transcriptional regulator [Dysgonamonadaceae bacterium]
MNFNISPMEFGPRFKKLLEKYKVSQKKFCDDTNTHPGLTSRYLRGNEAPSSDFIFKAINYFEDVDMNYFFGTGAYSVNEEPLNYRKDPNKIIEEIEYKLNELKAVMPQK